MLDRRPWLRGMAVLLALFVAISTAACASSSQAGPDGTDGTGPTETDPPKPCPVDALDHTQDTVP
ncbi:MAG: hypothetical protein ACXWCM_04530, partial [Acidimicrobiales bacterium]